MANFKLKTIKKIDYDRPDVEKGYANQTLCVDIYTTDIFIKPVTEKMKEVFIGGRGFGLYLLWQAVKGATRWDDPENTICIASGPLGGTPIYPGSGKSIVTAISPLTGSVIDSNVGGYFGPYLKFSGFDALEITGKSRGIGTTGRFPVGDRPSLEEEAKHGANTTMRNRNARITRCCRQSGDQAPPRPLETVPYTRLLYHLESLNPRRHCQRVARKCPRLVHRP